MTHAFTPGNKTASLLKYLSEKCSDLNDLHSGMSFVLLSGPDRNIFADHMILPDYALSFIHKMISVNTNP